MGTHRQEQEGQLYPSKVGKFIVLFHVVVVFKYRRNRGNLEKVCYYCCQRRLYAKLSVLSSFLGEIVWHQCVSIKQLWTRALVLDKNRHSSINQLTKIQGDNQNFFDDNIQWHGMALISTKSRHRVMHQSLTFRFFRSALCGLAWNLKITHAHSDYVFELDQFIVFKVLRVCKPHRPNTFRAKLVILTLISRWRWCL